MRKGLGPRGRGASPDKRIPWKLKGIYQLIFSFVLNRSFELAKALVFVEPSGEKPVDVRLFRREESVFKYLIEAKALGYGVLLLPNAIKVPKEAWAEYRKLRKKGESTLEVAVRYGILKEESLAEIKLLVLDLDSPYEEVRKYWGEFIETFGIKGYQLERSKSGNLKAFIPLTPVLTEKGLAWYRPSEKHNNGHTHLENARELLGIWIAWWQRKGIQADVSFFFNLNHPVWYPEIEVNGKVSKIEEANGEYAGTLYELYKRAKNVQARERLYGFRIGKTWLNLTAYFWGEKLPVKPEDYKRQILEKQKLKVPWFIKLLYENRDEEEKEERVNETAEINVEALYERAVSALASKHDSYRFIHVMLPAVGWAKYLGLSQSYVYDVLREAIPDKRNFDRDFKIAWNKAWELEFKVQRRGRKKKDFVSYLERTKFSDWTDKARRYLREKKRAYRQEILYDVFMGQRWLCDGVLNYLWILGEVRFEKEIHGRGRPRKVIIWAGDFRHINNNPPRACSSLGNKHSRLNGEVSEGKLKGEMKFSSPPNGGEAPKVPKKQKPLYVEETIRRVLELKRLLRFLEGLEGAVRFKELLRRYRDRSISLRSKIDALRKVGLLRVIRKGRLGNEYYVNLPERLNDFIDKLLEAENLYLNIYTEALKWIEWKKNTLKMSEKKLRSKRPCRKPSKGSSLDKRERIEEDVDVDEIPF